MPCATERVARPKPLALSLICQIAGIYTGKKGFSTIWVENVAETLAFPHFLQVPVGLSLHSSTRGFYDF